MVTDDTPSSSLFNETATQSEIADGSKRYKKSRSIKMSSHFLGATCDSLDRIAIGANGEFFSRIVATIKKLIDRLDSLSRRVEWKISLNIYSQQISRNTHIGACARIYPHSDHRFTVNRRITFSYSFAAIATWLGVQCISPRLFFTFAHEL